MLEAPAGRCVTVSGHRLFVDERGDRAAPPVLVIHGGSGEGCWDFMHVQGSRLARKLAVVGVDQRGCLRSDPLSDGSTLNLDELVEDFDRLRAELGFPRWALLGHSYGGNLALRYATTHPDRISAVVFENPTWDDTAFAGHLLTRVLRLLEEARDVDAAERCRRLLADSREPDVTTFWERQRLLDQLGAARQNLSPATSKSGPTRRSPAPGSSWPTVLRISCTPSSRASTRVSSCPAWPDPRRGPAGRRHSSRTAGRDLTSAHRCPSGARGHADRLGGLRPAWRAVGIGGEMRDLNELAHRLLDLTHRGAVPNITAVVVRTLVAMLAAFLAASWAWAVAYRDLGVVRYPLTTLTFLVIAGSAVYLAMGRPTILLVRARRESQALRQAEVELESERHRFIAELQDAFDMVAVETDARSLVGRALAIVHQGPGELLLADSSQAHMQAAAVSPHGSPGCGVATPSDCPAVQRGRSTHFPSSTALASCPRLTDRGPGRSALCVPVVILGRPMGVVHVTDPEGTEHTSAERQQVESLAAQAGARIGALRATSASQLAASSDPLTGLLNRRSLADEIQLLAVRRRAYAVAFIDLDKFKELNDTFGHAMGDHALRLFAKTLTAATRPGDILCRYGGEEFVVIFRDAEVGDAAPVVHRIREALALAVSTAAAGTPAFTGSFGLADSTYAADPVEVIGIADGACLQAKREGRDRLIIAERPNDQVLHDPAPQLTGHLPSERDLR